MWFRWHLTRVTSESTRAWKGASGGHQNRGILSGKSFAEAPPAPPNVFRPYGHIRFGLVRSHSSPLHHSVRPGSSTGNHYGRYVPRETRSTWKAKESRQGKRWSFGQLVTVVLSDPGPAFSVVLHVSACPRYPQSGPTKREDSQETPRSHRGPRRMCRFFHRPILAAGGRISWQPSGLRRASRLIGEARTNGRP